MKLSFMSFTCPQATLDEFLQYAVKYGYQGIEPRAEANHAHGIETDTTGAERAEIRRKFSDAGVELACLATSRKYALPAEDRPANIELSRQLIELAADCGATRMRIFGGVPPEGMDMSTAVQVVGESLAELAPFAADHGITLCLETHDAFSRAEDCAAAARLADSPAVGVNWDVMHPFTKGMTLDEAYAHVKGLVRHCHIHDGTYAEGRPTLALMGQGEIPHDRAVQLLAADGFEGYLSGEYINAWPPEEVLPHDAEVLRSYGAE